MKKSIENRITLEKFQKACKDCHSVSEIIKYILWALEAFSTVAVISAVSNGTYDKACEYVLDFVMIVTAALSFNFIAAILRSMKNSPTPFTYDISDKFIGLSNIITFGFVVYLICEIIMMFTPYKDTIFDSRSGFTTCGYLAAYYLCKGFEYIFNYGATLQQQSDETL